jgi:hypothetical protein
MKLVFSGEFSKNTQVSNFMKICPVGAESFCADGRTDRHDEGSSFRNFANTPKKTNRKDLCMVMIVVEYWNETERINTVLSKIAEYWC